MTPGLRIEYKKQSYTGRWIFLVIVIALLAATGYFAYQWYTKGALPPVPLPASAMADPSINETPVTKEEVEQHTVPANNPRYISIPSLAIEKTRIIPVGLTSNNLLDTPKNIDDTAWYQKSATPGSGSGAVVINGHNGGVSRNGVFARLADIREGDRIKIERGDGREIDYIVKSSKTMSLAEANNTGMRDMMQSIEPSKEGLSIITCAGNWVPRDKVFDKRVMIRAVADV